MVFITAILILTKIPRKLDVSCTPHGLFSSLNKCQFISPGLLSDKLKRQLLYHHAWHHDPCECQILGFKIRQLEFIFLALPFTCRMALANLLTLSDP